jgi:hypothetical protein
MLTASHEDSDLHDDWDPGSDSDLDVAEKEKLTASHEDSDLHDDWDLDLDNELDLDLDLDNDRDIDLGKVLKQSGLLQTDQHL